MIIDVNFNFYSDTPKGKDPDSYSYTLRKYHQLLWNKPLPNGSVFNLDLKTPKILHHKSQLGEFYLSSDSLAHDYSKWKSTEHIIKMSIYIYIYIYIYLKIYILFILFIL